MLRAALAVLALALPAAAAPPTEGLALWLDAGDLRPGPVEAWTSKTSGGLRAVQPTRAARPTAYIKVPGRKTTVRFDGNDFLTLGRPDALPFATGSPFTIVAVADVAPDRIGTFLAKGGGADANRAIHFYVATDRIGAIAYGARREARRPAGPCVATLVCDGKRATVVVNGERLTALAVGRGRSDADVLIGCRRKEADNTGTHWPLTGDLAELLVYTRALGDAELRTLNRQLGEKYGIVLAASSAEALAKLPPFDAAERLLRLAQANRLTDDLAGAAAALLDHDDPFVRGMAEWALAMKTGGENNGQQARWSRDDPPAWLRAWLAFPPERRVEADWVRQAVSRGIHRDSRKLLADVNALAERMGRMGRHIHFPFERVRDMVAAIQGISRTLGRGAAALPRQRQHWLDARRAMRAIALRNPAIDFDRVVCVTQFAPHTVRNITRSYQWKHKPGGDIAIVDLRRGEARPVLRKRLGAGFVWGLDLWWDADRVVFGYAKQPKWPPAVNTANYLAEGRNVHRLRASGDHPPLHIYEVGTDGSGLKQLTNDGYWNDFEPTYCADGSVVFASDRCGRSAECGNDTYDHMNPNLYIRTPDGRIRQLTDNKDIDRYPHSLADGRIAYTHWEYQERHFMEVHSLWTVRPDGTMSDALFKHHMRAPCALRDARSVPGTNKLVAIATGHHTFAYGPLVVIDPAKGTNTDSGIAIITPGVRVQEGKMAGTPIPGGGVLDAGGLYQTPFALSDTCFLACYSYARPNCTAPAGVDSNGFGLYLVDVFGNRELLYRDPLLSCAFPIPLRKRLRPPVLPRSSSLALAPAPALAPALALARSSPLSAGGVEDEDDDEDEDDLKTPATCYVTDVYDGLPGVPRGAIKHIRIAQHVGWPLDPTRGAMHYIPGNAGSTHLGFQSWSPVRVLGTVPVEADGSAHFTVPADKAIYFQALDRDHMEVRRMRSMVSFKAGETRGCRGCHESQAKAPAPTPHAPVALQRPADVPKPPPWGAERLLGYEWLVQPILDRHCVRCHSSEKPDGGIDLSRTRAADGLLQSYRTLFGVVPGKPKPGRRLVAVANRFDGADVTRPKQFGSHRSPFITALRDALHRKEVKLSDADWLSLVTWVDANAPYYDAFVNKRPPGGGPPRRDVVPGSAASFHPSRAGATEGTKP